MNLNVPLDFERLPEFWLLLEALRTRVRPVTPPLSDGQLAEQAQLLFLRLWVVLGYLARHTNKPGLLDEAGMRQVNGAFPQYGDDCLPVQVMDGNLLRLVEGGYQCDLFAGTNAHLSGSHISPEKRGNNRSRLAAAKNNIAASAVHQGQLLPLTIFKKRDGSDMAHQERQKCMLLIITLDRCLNPVGFKAVHRPDTTYTQGLMADACAAVETVAPEQLQEFYGWVLDQRGLPLTPKTTEDLLAQWDVFYKTSLAKI